MLELVLEPAQLLTKELELAQTLAIPRAVLLECPTTTGAAEAVRGRANAVRAMWSVPSCTGELRVSVFERVALFSHEAVLGGHMVWYCDPPGC